MMTLEAVAAESGEQAVLKRASGRDAAGSLHLREEDAAFVPDERAGTVDRILTGVEADEATGIVIEQGLVFRKDVRIPERWIMTAPPDRVEVSAAIEQIGHALRIPPVMYVSSEGNQASPAE
jgi:hypothetical protein